MNKDNKEKIDEQATPLSPGEAACGKVNTIVEMLLDIPEQLLISPPPDQDGILTWINAGKMKTAAYDPKRGRLAISFIDGYVDFFADENATAIAAQLNRFSENQRQQMGNNEL